MSDLIERLREQAEDTEFAISLQTEAADLIEAQQAEIAEYKKQIERMGSSVQHYENLAMKFSSQADVYSHDRQRAWAEIARLRGLAEESYREGFTDGQFTDSLQTASEAWSVSDTRRALEQKP